MGTRENRGQEAGPHVGGKGFKRVGSRKRAKGRKPRNRCRSWECKIWEMGDLDPPVLPSPLTLPLPHTFRVQQNIKKLAGI